MNYNKIDKLLQSTDIEDVKLGVLLFCNNNNFNEIIAKFTGLPNNIDYREMGVVMPEHPIEGKGVSVLIGHRRFGICTTTKNPIEGEIF